MKSTQGIKTEAQYTFWITLRLPSILRGEQGGTVRLKSFPHHPTNQLKTSHLTPFSLQNTDLFEMIERMQVR